jgi:hypothetical protein
MRRTFVIIIALLLVLMAGCSMAAVEEGGIALPEAITAESTMAEEPEALAEDQSSFQEVDSADAKSALPEAVAGLRAAEERPAPIQDAAPESEPVTVSQEVIPAGPVSEQEEEQSSEEAEPPQLEEEHEREEVPVPDTEEETVEGPAEESYEEPEEAEPAFDIGSWISFAQGTAQAMGLRLESSAVDCWDNPITANPNCIYLERDITARLSLYAADPDITDVWFWYESTGENSYLIYIGYA